jgi:hypothetical protein
MALRRITGWPRGLTVLLVEQEDVGDDRSILETVVAADSVSLRSIV